MIDLHMHSNHSDGSDSVTELLKKAEKMDLKAIAITDHDTCTGHMELRNIDKSKFYSGIIIPGVELRCFYKRRIIEVLAYNIDIDKMQAWLDKFYEGKGHADVQKKYLRQLYKTCMELDLYMPKIDEIKWDPEGEWAARTIYREMKADERNKEKLPQDLWEDYENFRHKYCYNLENIFYIDKSEDLPTLPELLEQIKNAGGLAFLPHIYVYKWAENKEEFINELVDNYDIDGMECYYNNFTKEQTDYLVNLCNTKGLYKSGGSDYHGTKRPEVEMGIGKGNLSVPDEILDVWKNKHLLQTL